MLLKKFQFLKKLSKKMSKRNQNWILFPPRNPLNKINNKLTINKILRLFINQRIAKRVKKQANLIKMMINLKRMNFQQKRRAQMKMKLLKNQPKYQKRKVRKLNQLLQDLCSVKMQKLKRQLQRQMMA